VDLVEEEDRRRPPRCARSRRAITSRTSRAPALTAESSSNAALGVLGGEPRERRLARAGGP
jgi:hypothetical protein